LHGKCWVVSLQCSSDSEVSEAFNSSRVYISLTLRGSHGIIGKRAKTSIHIRTHFETPGHSWERVAIGTTCVTVSEGFDSSNVQGSLQGSHAIIGEHTTFVDTLTVIV